MLRGFRMLAADDAGFVIAAELVLVLTISVLGMVVGLTAVRDAVTNELNDLSNAFGAVNQSYSVAELNVPLLTTISGFGFSDTSDDCDCNVIVYSEVTGKLDPSAGAANEGNL